MPNLYVKNMEGETVKTIPVTGGSRKAEKVLRGLLINMDRDRFYVDDSEFDDSD